MALSAFSERFAAYDVTPIENLFILEYMTHAPGDYVRVYLYGLMLCHHPDADATLESVATALNMQPDAVMNAFLFWEQKGLVIGVSDNPPRFQFENVRSIMGGTARDDLSAAYQYKNFNAELQRILGLLHPKEFQKAMEWVEDLGLGQEVVLAIVREMNRQLTNDGQKKRSLPYLFKAFDTCAMDFAAQGIKTKEAALQALSRGNPDHQLAAKVVTYLGIKRAPTKAEVELAHKWLHEWQLSDKDINAALRQTTGSANPSFAYLDKILERHRQAGGDVGTAIELDKQLHDAAREIVSALGAQKQPTKDQTAQIKNWIEQGFEPAALMRAAMRCSRSGRRTFDQFEMEVSRWAELGITTEAKAEAYNKQYAELRKLATEVFSRAGIDKKPTEAELKQLKAWLDQSGEALILYAADCANGLKMPLRGMAKNLSQWHDSGINEVEAAEAMRKDKSAQHKSKPQEGQPRPAALDYEQRTYEPGFFDDFFADLSGGEGESK